MCDSHPITTDMRFVAHQPDPLPYPATNVWLAYKTRFCIFSMFRCLCKSDLCGASHIPNVVCNNFFPLKVECREILKKERKFNFFFFKRRGEKRYFCSKYSQKWFIDFIVWKIKRNTLYYIQTFTFKDIKLWNKQN